MELRENRQRSVVNYVRPQSIAAELGIRSGDVIVSLNGEPIEDIIEFSFLEAEEYIELEILHKNGEHVLYEIEKEIDEQLGLEFSNPIMDSIKSCSNKCMFCFIDQLPKGMRKSLYIKDDDSRLSFLQGNFITMTNMKDTDIEKMIKYRISPVNISVHTTNPELRVKLLKNRFAGDICKKIRKLYDANINMNAQIVCIPKVNDKEELSNTVNDLKKFYPQMQSVAVVPVGITRFRENLPEIIPFDKASAAELITQIEELQANCLRELGTRFVFLSDEFYILAQKELPPEKEYEEYIQLENGVGLIRKFEEEVIRKLRSMKACQLPNKTKITIATGVSAYDFMCRISEMLLRKFYDLEINVVCIKNHFFGESITVAGLITATDLIMQLKSIDLGDALFLPKVMLRFDEDIFLDDITVEELEASLKTQVVINDIDGEILIENIIKLRS